MFVPSTLTLISSKRSKQNITNTKNLSETWKDWPEEDRVAFAQSIKFWTPEQNEVTYHFIFIHLLRNAETRSNNEEQRKRFENYWGLNHSINSEDKFCFDVDIELLKTPEPPRKIIEET